jgi:hypothetical protein
MATNKQKRKNRRARSAANAEAFERSHVLTEEQRIALEEKAQRPGFYDRFSYRVRGHAEPLTFEFSGIPVPYDESDPSKDLVEKTVEVESQVPDYKH